MSASQLVAELKLEHKAIFQLLEEIFELGVESRAGQDKLMAAKDLFMAHLHKEDKHLHAVLSEEEKRNEEIRETMYLMNFNLKDVTKYVEIFFNKYIDGADMDEFECDFDMINVLLRNRMRREEKVLFREFEKLGV